MSKRYDPRNILERIRDGFMRLSLGPPEMTERNVARTTAEILKIWRLPDHGAGLGYEIVDDPIFLLVKSKRVLDYEFVQTAYSLAIGAKRTSFGERYYWSCCGCDFRDHPPHHIGSDLPAQSGVSIRNRSQ